MLKTFCEFFWANLVPGRFVLFLGRAIRLKQGWRDSYDQTQNATERRPNAAARKVYLLLVIPSNWSVDVIARTWLADVIARTVFCNSLKISILAIGGWAKMPRIQILNATDRQAIDSQMTGAIVKREDGPLAEPPTALDL